MKSKFIFTVVVGVTRNPRWPPRCYNSTELADSDLILLAIFWFQLITRDQANNSMFSRADIIIHILDVNDNRPMFSQASYNATIPEDAPAGTSVRRISVSATSCILIIKTRYLTVLLVGFHHSIHLYYCLSEKKMYKKTLRDFSESTVKYA